MRRGLEGVLFWVGTVIVPLVLWLGPGLRVWSDNFPTSGWLPVVPIGLGLLWGLARANYERVTALQVRLDRFEVRPTDKEVDLVGFGSMYLVHSE
jgi:hypothetical protein